MCHYGCGGEGIGRCVMNTPICDFVEKYKNNTPVRAHMPGHKGEMLLGFEDRDITEINGADSLFEAEGIIKQSEENASRLFGCKTFYSAEGSSLSIKAMVYLFKLWGKEDSVIFAARNAHKAFISAVALADVDLEWLYPAEGSYLSGNVDISALEKLLKADLHKSKAVYITTPDYLGGMADVKRIAEICKKYGALLLVDNAHGAYLKFFENSLHPIDLGATMCCDSAHKTLPVLTGGGYLHIVNGEEFFIKHVKDALALFGSTSPSYLILQSLDRANLYLHNGYKEKLERFIGKLNLLKAALKEKGFTLLGNEPLKIVISAKEYGYLGFELGKILENENIYCEFADKDHLVLMLTPENRDEDLENIRSALTKIEKRAAINDIPPKIEKAEKALSLREAVFSECEMIDVKNALGRIIGEFNISCPPAVPILVCGETIDKKAIECFNYYCIEKCKVIKHK